LVNVLGRKMEITPKGSMLLLENNDVPGVIGKVGTMLGDRNINIAAYLLDRRDQNGKAFGVIRLDNTVEQEDILLLRNLEEIEWVGHVKVKA